MFSPPSISTLALTSDWLPDLTQLDQPNGVGQVSARLVCCREVAAGSEFSDVRRCSFTPQFHLLAKVPMVEQLRTILDNLIPDKICLYRFHSFAQSSTENIHLLSSGWQLCLTCCCHAQPNGAAAVLCVSKPQKSAVAYVRRCSARRDAEGWHASVSAPVLAHPDNLPQSPKCALRGVDTVVKCSKRRGSKNLAEGSVRSAGMGAKHEFMIHMMLFCMALEKFHRRDSVGGLFGGTVEGSNGGPWL